MSAVLAPFLAHLPKAPVNLRAHPVLRLTSRLKPIRWQAAGAYGAMLLASGIALVVPLALRDVIDAATGERPAALGFLPDGLSDRGRLVAGAGLVVGLALVRSVVSSRSATAPRGSVAPSPPTCDGTSWPTCWTARWPSTTAPASAS